MIGNTIAAICTLGLMSFAIKDNPYYRFAEYTFVALALSKAFVMSYERIYPQIITPIVNGRYIVIIPVLLGLLLYAPIFTKSRYLVQFPISIFVGVGVGVSLKGIISTQVIHQVHNTYSGLNSIGDIIVLVGVICVLLFFFFSRNENGKKNAILTTTNKIGRVFMMIAFGSLFGNTVLGRMALLIGRIKFLLVDWLHLLA